jgi:hypothetical protein
MKYLLSTILILMLSVGCVSISVKKQELVDKDGKLYGVNTEYKYHRGMGSQNLEGVEFTKLEDGTIDFKIGKQSGENQLDSVLNNLSEFMKNMAKMAATGGVSMP